MTMRRWQAFRVVFFCLFVLTTAVLRAGAGELSGTGAPLDEILARARQSAETFWEQFRSVTCVEKVTQEKLGKKGNAEYRQKSTFDYMVLLKEEKDELAVEESRLQQGRKGKSKRVPLLVTSGVPTLLLIFHPYYQENFSYEMEGEETAGGQRLMRMRFEHIPGKRSTTAVRLRGKDHPLDIQGTAWIDPETGAIHRIVAGLAAPMTDINLKAMEMDVTYGSRRFSSGIYRLPSTAMVGIRTERQHWRNTHHYSNYKRFTVASETVVSK